MVERPIDNESIQEAILAALDKRQSVESTYEDLLEVHAAQAKSIDGLVKNADGLVKNADGLVENAREVIEDVRQMSRGNRAMIELIKQGLEESRRQRDDIRQLVLALSSE